jgi:chromosomal replication initiation ATPase DnaA
MIDPLLFEYGVTISLIKEKVCLAMNIEASQMETPDKMPGIRKRESVTARQISMTLSKQFTTKSLQAIGDEHGGRDHATVLNACKMINNLLDTNDPVVTLHFLRSKKSIETFIEHQKKMKYCFQENSIFNTEK